MEFRAFKSLKLRSRKCARCPRSEQYLQFSGASAILSMRLGMIGLDSKHELDRCCYSCV